MNDKMTDPFGFNIDLRQGDVTSTNIFYFHINDLCSHLRNADLRGIFISENVQTFHMYFSMMM